MGIGSVKGLIFYCVGSGGRVWVARLGSKFLYLWGYPLGSVFSKWLKQKSMLDLGNPQYCFSAMRAVCTLLVDSLLLFRHSSLGSPRSAAEDFVCLSL